MIEARGLSVVLDRRRVLDGVDLVVEPGQLVALIGPPESGKSVLLRAIAGLVPLASGDLRICGIGGDDDGMRRQRRLRIGMAFQNDALFDAASVFANVAMPLLRRQIPEAEVAERVREVLVAVGLAESADKLPGELSGGMRKRAGIARAIVARPEVGLFDDPVAGLDPVTGARILDLIAATTARLRMASLVVSNDLGVLLPRASRVIMLYEGAITFDGPTAGLSTAESAVTRQFVSGEDSGPL